MSSRRKTNREFTALGDVLSRVLSGFERKSRSDLSRVHRVWDSCVGDAIATNTRPVALKGAQLVVVVTNSAWLHELQFLKQDLLDRINRQAGEDIVEDIRFRIGTF